MTWLASRTDETVNLRSDQPVSACSPGVNLHTRLFASISECLNLQRGDMDREEINANFMSLTNTSPVEAEFYLGAANYDLDRAVQMYYGPLFIRAT